MLGKQRIGVNEPQEAKTWPKLFGAGKGLQFLEGAAG
jgi:hypothetical protein